MSAEIQTNDGLFTSLLAAPEASSAAASLTCACGGCAGEGGADPGAYATTPTSGSYDYVAQAAIPQGGSLAPLMAGSKWSGIDSDTARTVVSFSFIDPQSSTFAYGADASFTNGMASFSEADRQLTRDVLAKISEVCNVQFVEVADDATECGVLRYGYSQESNAMGYAGYAFFPSASAAGGDIWIGANQAGAQWDFYRPNLVLHETLHALGLKHPFSGDSVLATEQNIIPNTVMSYSALAGGTKSFMNAYPSEPMALDVAALQQLYGASSQNTGNDSYNLAASDWQDGFHALWDSGGTDTLDASAIARGVTLNLNSGASSDIGVRVGAHATVAGTVKYAEYTNTFTLAQGVQIENAIGSSFGDVVKGNALDNRLEGRGGNDQIDGGWGMDTAVYAGARAGFVVAQANGVATVQDLSGAEGADALSGIERIQFGNGKLALDIGGHAGEAAKLIGAVFGADALESAGDVGRALSLLDAGVPYASLMGMALDLRLGADPSDAEVVDLLYTNVIGHAPSAGAAQPFIDMLQSGAATHASLAVMAADTGYNAEQIGLVGLWTTGLDYA